MDTRIDEINIMIEEMDRIRKEEWMMSLNISMAEHMKKHQYSRFVKSIHPYKQRRASTDEEIERFFKR